MFSFPSHSSNITAAMSLLCRLWGFCRHICFRQYCITFIYLYFFLIFLKNDSELLLLMNVTDCSRHFQPILILFLVPAACLCIVLSTAVDQQEEPLAEVLLACVILCWLLFCWRIWRKSSCYKCWFLFPLHKKYQLFVVILNDAVYFLMQSTILTYLSWHEEPFFVVFLCVIAHPVYIQKTVINVVLRWCY